MIFAVWQELEKENKEFFEAYAESQSRARQDRMSEEETTRMIQKLIANDNPPASSSSTKDAPST